MKEIRFLERLAENLLEGGFARALKPKLQPVQIAKSLARAMDRTQLVGTDAPLVANQYQVFLHPEDLATFSNFQVALERELTDYLAGYAARSGYRPLTEPRVKLHPDDSVRPGRVRAEAAMVDPEPSLEISPSAPPLWEGTIEMPAVQPAPSSLDRPPAALVDTGGQRFELSRDTATIGRAVDNDIVLEGKGVSRHHAKIAWEEGRYVLFDLNSTNGSFVNGNRVKRAVLSGGEETSFAGSVFTFSLDKL